MSEASLPTSRRRRRRAVYAACAVVAALAMLELSSRLFVHFARVPMGRLKYDLSLSIYEPHPHIGYACRPQAQGQGWRINNVGFRGGDVSPARPPSVYRIAALGASTTFGIKVGEETTYPRQLEKVLAARLRGKPRVQVVNAGVPGYTTAETLASLCFRVLDLCPNMVIVYHGINDVHPRVADGFRPDYAHFRQRIELGFQKNLFDHAFGRSYLYLCFRNLLLRKLDLTTVTVRQNTALMSFEKQKANFDKTTSDAFRRNVRHIIRTCKADDVVPVLVTFVVHREALNESETMNPEVYAKGVMQHNEALRQIATEEELFSIDLAKRFPQDRRLFSGPVHFVEEGNRIRAGMIADALLDSGLIQEPATRPNKPE